MLHFFWNSAFIFGFITFLFLCTNLKEIVRCVRLYAQLRFIFLSWSKKSENVWRRKVASSWKQRGTKQAEKIWSIYNLKKGIGNLISDFRTSFQLSITSSSSSLRDKISQKGLKNKYSEGEESIAEKLRNNPFFLQLSLHLYFWKQFLPNNQPIGYFLEPPNTWFFGQSQIG